MNEIPLGVLIAALLFVVAMAAIAVVAHVQDRRLRFGDYELLPYRWGYFFGLATILAGLLLIALGSYLFQASTLINGVVPFAWGLTAVVSGVGVVMRRRWGWVVATIVSLNPVAWIANLIYARKRWREFEGRIEIEPQWYGERAEGTLGPDAFERPASPRAGFGEGGLGGFAAPGAVPPAAADGPSPVGAPAASATGVGGFSISDLPTRPMPDPRLGPLAGGNAAVGGERSAREDEPTVPGLGVFASVRAPARSARAAQEPTVPAPAPAPDAAAPAPKPVQPAAAVDAPIRGRRPDEPTLGVIPDIAREPAAQAHAQDQDQPASARSRPVEAPGVALDAPVAAPTPREPPLGVIPDVSRAPAAQTGPSTGGADAVGRAPAKREVGAEVALQPEGAQPPDGAPKAEVKRPRDGAPKAEGAPRTDSPYEQALVELETRAVHRPTWARAIAEGDGDAEKTKARYIRLRAESLIRAAGG